MPHPTLAELAAAEAEIERIVRSLTGTMEEKTERLRSAGVFRRYAELFRAYLALAEPPRSDVEALKRATFLAWYEVVEPPCFTGVAELPADSQRRLVELLESLAAELDDELRQMLAWYCHIADWAFPGLESHPGLAALVESGDRDGWRAMAGDGERMAGRGLMGSYWRSIFDAHAASRRRRGGGLGRDPE